MIPQVMNFIVLGLLGGFANVLLWSKGWKDFTSLESCRYLVLGAIIGYLYTYLHSDYNFPNFVMTFVAGYMGPDFIQGILERFKKGGG